MTIFFRRSSFSLVLFTFHSFVLLSSLKPSFPENRGEKRRLFSKLPLTAAEHYLYTMPFFSEMRHKSTAITAQMPSDTVTVYHTKS